MSANAPAQLTQVTSFTYGRNQPKRICICASYRARSKEIRSPPMIKDKVPITANSLLSRQAKLTEIQIAFPNKLSYRGEGFILD